MPARPTSGFGVIELAVAVVLLGMLMFLTLRGAAVIDTMKSIIVGRELRQFQSLVAVYVGEHGSLPGDDPNAAARFGRPRAMSMVGRIESDTSGNLKLDGKLSDPANVFAETYVAWSDLRSAGLLEGERSVYGFSAQPENPFGGVYGFDEGNLGQRNGSICATRIPGRPAQLIDERMDDGWPGQGKLVATSAYAVDQGNHFESPDRGAYDVEKEYIICIQLNP